ncbi:cytochrome P450 [Nocardia terpenica]
MKPPYWFRWLTRQGVLRLGIRACAWRGDVLAQLLATSAGVRDPYPLIESIRARGRLVRSSAAWVTADYDLCRNILRDNRFGVPVADGGNIPQPLRRLARSASLPLNPVEPPSMLASNPPDHTRLRRPVASAFTPRAIGRLRDRAESVTEELLDALPTGESVDLVATFASQVPIAIISDILGFPDEARELFSRWGDDIVPLLDIGISWHAYRYAVTATMEMDSYLDDHIARLRSRPGEDILSSLVVAGELDDRELKASASLLMGAGFETTMNLIGNGVIQLLNHPEQLACLRADPQLWPNAIAEVLRIDTPVQAIGRIALCDTEIEGISLRSGSIVVLLLNGANRDPKVFSDPHRLDITRTNAQEHLAFSSGIHACLGASLACMEGIYALRGLFERFPDIQLTGPPERRPLFTLHGYSHVPALLLSQ